MNSIELFSGIGGMALGLSQSGFKHIALFENSKAACNVLRENQRLGIPNVKDWNIIEGDVCNYDYSKLTTNIALLSAGPPCQPFSFGGKHIGSFDERNLFPEIIRAIQILRPKAILIENVKGILRKSFFSYFSYILLQLSHPTVLIKKGEKWGDHFSRLERYHLRGNYQKFHYNIVFRVMNTANYGVPQKRDRIFIVGFRNDLGVKWSFPDYTHSYDALLWSQFVTGDYWRKYNLSPKAMPKNNLFMPNNIGLFPPLCKPWRTVRDAICDLPSFNDKKIANHTYISGARIYKGHTGSLYDEPAKTIKAGVHGVPGGENMLRLEDGNVRYFTLRECARLQTFPDDFFFPCSWSAAMKGLGNSVPVELSRVLGMSIFNALKPVKSDETS